MRGFAAVALLAIAVGTAMPTAAQRPEPEAIPFDFAGETFAAIRVPDVQAAAIWYGRVFALTVVNQIDAEDGRYHIRILDRPGLSVELLQIRDDIEPPSAHLGLFKVGFYVDDIDAALAWARDRGVTSAEEIFTDDALGARSFLLRDPWGNRIQLFERTASH